MPRLRPAQHPPEAPARLTTGCYLEDGERLWRVLDACDGQVVLEDCNRPDEPACCVDVQQVLDTMNRVVPKG